LQFALQFSWPSSLPVFWLSSPRFGWSWRAFSTPPPSLCRHATTCGLFSRFVSSQFAF
jgi:hypothetical protein